jgi:hypothetical protein
MTESLSQAQQSLMKLVNNRKLAQLVGSTLAEIAVELMDAKQEAAHWKAAFEAVRDEIRILAGVAIKQKGGERLVITKTELERMPTNTELHVGTPEPGVRIYELRQRTQVSQAVSKILQAH